MLKKNLMMISAMVLLCLMTITGLFTPSKSFSFNLQNDNEILLKYQKIELYNHLDYEVFVEAVKGYKKWKFNNNKVLTIIDFSKPSYEKRFYVIDLDKEKLLHKTYVTHGKKSGITYANNFSNIIGSHQSSVGFFSTAETYHGKHGYSLRLDGLEKDKNDMARKRAIVIHASTYAKKSFIERYGRLGRSLGCPALPPEKSKEIIKQIKNGSCLFVYAKNSQVS